MAEVMDYRCVGSASGYPAKRSTFKVCGLMLRGRDPLHRLTRVDQHDLQRSEQPQNRLDSRPVPRSVGGHDQRVVLRVQGLADTSLQKGHHEQSQQEAVSQRLGLIWALEVDPGDDDRVFHQGKATLSRWLNLAFHPNLPGRQLLGREVGDVHERRPFVHLLAQPLWGGRLDRNGRIARAAIRRGTRKICRPFPDVQTTTSQGPQACGGPRLRVTH